MKKNIVRLLIFIIAFIEPVIGYSQQPQPNQLLKMPEVVPASPDAAAIEKFGNIPVSYTTGVPNISIPIYTIKCGSLSWPVSLSYHAGGIRVDESASMAGLGWSVNAVGSITRSRVGRHDEESNTEPVYPNITTADHAYLYAVLNGTADSELDVFNFNFNGKSGKFVVRQDGTVFQVPLSNLKISYTSNFNSFTIKDESGVAYTFDVKEMTTSQSMPAELTSTYYTSTWYLSQVELPDKNNKIVFTYADAGTTYETYRSFSQTVGDKWVLSGSSAIFQNVNDNSQSATFVNVGVRKISSIAFPNGTLTFNYDAAYRLDIGTGSNVSNKLTSININSIFNAVTTQLKRFTFYSSYFFYNPTAVPTNSTHYRLRLDSLTESGINSEPTPKKYKFAYNSTPLPPRQSYGQDMWGFSNGQWANPSLLQTQSITFNNGSYNLSFSFGDANRNVDTVQMKGWMLNTIYYPTGGRTEFTFDSHLYSAEQNLSSVDERNANVFGSQSYPQTTTTTFTYPTSANSPDARVIVDMSMFNFPNVTQPSWVSIKDLVTNAIVYTKTQNNPYQRAQSDEPIKLVLGRNYEIKAYVYSTVSNAQLDASIKIRWFNYTSTPDIRKGGGLRVRSIKSYTSGGTIASTESYIYDTATTLTPFALLQRNYSEVIFRLGKPFQAYPDPVCTYYYSPLCRIYTASPAYAVTTAMGSPMLYRRIQKITTDSATGAINGKS